MKHCPKCNNYYDDYFIACPSCDLDKTVIDVEEVSDESEEHTIGPFDLFKFGKKAYFEEFFIQLKIFRTTPDRPRSFKNLTDKVGPWTIFFSMILTFFLMIIYAIHKLFIN